MPAVQYTFCITHETMRRLGIHDYDAGKLTIDIRGWDGQNQRPCSHYSPTGFQLEKFTIQAFYSEKFTGTYGESLGLELGGDLLTLAEIARYSKPLKALHKRLAAIEAKYGPALTVGQTLAYVADALGIQQFARPNHHYASAWQPTTNIQDAIYWVDGPVAAFHEAHPHTAVSA